MTVKNPTPEEKAERSPAYYYACAHQVANTACSLCQPGQPTMPDNWVESYEPPAPAGITDATD